MDTEKSGPMTANICQQLALFAIMIALSGCDSRAVNKAAFDSAKPELQQVWQRALAASKANEYFRASTNFVSLLSRDLTPDQLVAVQDALANLNERIHTAAAKGDSKAKDALSALKHNVHPPRPVR